MDRFVYLLAALCILGMGAAAYFGTSAGRETAHLTPAGAMTATPPSAPSRTARQNEPLKAEIKVSGITITRGSYGYPETDNDTDLTSEDFINHTGRDSAGNRLEGAKGRYLPPEHIPDVRMYYTAPRVFSRLVLYRHFIASRPQITNVSVHKKVNGRDCFITAYFADPKDFGKRYSHRRVKIKKGFVLTEYDIFDDARGCDALLAFFVDPETRRYLRVLTHNGTDVWASVGYRPLDVKKSGKRYVILTSGGVEYITLDKGHIISDIYLMRFERFYPESPINDAPKYHIESGQILTDNIVRIKYRNGAVAHYKVALTYDDYQKSFPKESGAENKNVIGCPSVIWHNGMEFGPKSLDTMPAWDFNDNSSKEPTYK
ncbi:MAG: hypothetical protein IK083_05615 [Abditibacteriota bacterium]|nr:hypothetical protein [Abditibacteriota bacterium]